MHKIAKPIREDDSTRTTNVFSKNNTLKKEETATKLGGDKWYPDNIKDIYLTII
jgi:hypothetical protein